ncbi:MAG: thioesterase domain-containing protein, partial [Salaquimonas sp.]
MIMKTAHLTLSLLILQLLSSSAMALHDNSGHELQYSYFINGLASSIPEIGRGLDTLSDEIGGSYFSYMTPIESSVISASILQDVRQKLRQNPGMKFNIIGTSFGGNIATIVAAQLNQIGAQVNYLAIIDAPAPIPVTKNVHRVDNFFCRKIGCIGQKIRLDRNNSATWLQEF